MEFVAIGKGVERYDAVDKVTGQAKFTHDLVFPGMLHVKVLGSPYAHARIKSIDASEAWKVPGVHAVVTGKDFPYRIGIYFADRPVLALDKVRVEGEPVVAVAAESEEIAEEALSKIKVEYEELPPVLDVREAIKPDAPLVHEELHTYKRAPVFYPKKGTNIANHFKLRKGNIEEAFRKADLVVEGEYFIPQIHHVQMETHAAIALYGHDGRLTVWTSAQSPFTVRYLLSQTFNIPIHKIRVIIPYVGGGFGGKAGLNHEVIPVALALKCPGKPIKWVLTREEVMEATVVRTGLYAKIKTAVSKEGKILGEKIEYYWDCGAYAQYGVNIVRATGYSAVGPYYVPNVWVDSYGVYTNHPSSGAFRGFGHVEFHWAIERHRDLIAEKLGMDPVEFRLKNVLKPGDETITGEKVTEYHGRVDKCIEAVAKEIKWYEEPKVRDMGTKIRAKGIAALQKAPAMPTNAASSAIVKFNEDATVTLLVSNTDIGQGTPTALAQIAAEVLKMPVEKIMINKEKDTEFAPYDWQTVASRGLYSNGRAVIRACEDAIRQIKEIASEALGLPPEELEVGYGRVYERNNPGYGLPLESVVMGYTYPDGHTIGGPVIGRGSFIPEGLTNLDPETGQGLPAANWTYGCYGVEIEIDKETGEINVLKVVGAFDIGRVVNPRLALGQAYGGAVQGLSAGMVEVIAHNEKGHLLNKSFVDYKIFTVSDMPTEMKIIFIETPQRDGPFGVRGIAEHSMISVASAVGNAIKLATGADIFDMPLTPERVWRAINRAKEGR